MASKVLKKINAKLKFLYRQCRYLTPAYRRLLCNALIQPHFDYGCSSWFPLLKTNLKLKLQKAQNKCICFCLNLPPGSHTNPSHFRKITWLPVSDRVKYCIANTVFKKWNGIVSGYIHEIFKPSLCIYSTRLQMPLDIPLRKKNTGQKMLILLPAKKYGPKYALVSKMLEHHLLLCMLLRKIIYFIFEANSSYYHILMIDFII